MSDDSYYNSLLTKQIQFHLDFLDEFKDVFEQEPRRSALHLQMLAKNNMQLGNWKEGLWYYKKLIKYRPDFKTFALIPYVVIQKIKRLWTTK